MSARPRRVAAEGSGAPSANAANAASALQKSTPNGSTRTTPKASPRAAKTEPRGALRHEVREPFERTERSHERDDPRAGDGDCGERAGRDEVDREHPARIEQGGHRREHEREPAEERHVERAGHDGDGRGDEDRDERDADPERRVRQGHRRERGGGQRREPSSR